MTKEYPFKPGQSGNPNGRPKGSKNRVKRLKVSEILASMNYEPFAELVNMARNARSEKVRCDAMIELCSYVAPKLRQIEYKTDSDSPFIISLNMAPHSKHAEAITVTPNLEHIEDEESIENIEADFCHI